MSLKSSFKSLFIPGALIHDGTVSEGMIPKVKTCVEAVKGGAEGAVIMDGRAPHALLVELFKSNELQYNNENINFDIKVLSSFVDK